MIIRNTQALAFDTIAASGNGLEYNTIAAKTPW